MTAEDVVCDGCVDTADIADEAVTTNKLSPSLQQQISESGPDRTDDLCKLYSLLHERAVIGDLNVPSYCTLESKEPKIVFLTEHIYTTDLGGLSGADSICQERATNAGLQGSFRAWLSDRTISAAQRMTHNKGPYVRTDGVVVAYDWSDLIDSEIMASISVGAVPGQPITQGLVATGTAFNGDRQLSGTGTDNAFCDDWTGSNYGVTFIGGDSTQTSPGWTDGAGFPCNTTGFEVSLYCIEQ